MFLGFFAWYAGLARGGVAKIGQVQLAQPVLSSAWAALILGESVGRATVVAALVVLACVAATQRARGCAAVGSAAMAISTDAVGKRYPPPIYAVGREKIREYALAVGETNPLHLDVEAARAAGLPRRRRAADVRRRLLRRRRWARPSSTPRSASTSRRLVHGGQEFRVGAARRRRRRDHDDGDGQGHRGARRQGLLRLRVRVHQPGRRHRVRRHLDQHRAGRREPCRAGDEIPELQVTPDRYLTVRYAGASGDFNPIHIDEEFAKQVGLPGPDPARAVDDGPGRARPDRGRRRARTRSSA